MRSSQDEPRRTATATARTAMTPTPATAKLARGEARAAIAPPKRKPMPESPLASDSKRPITRAW